MPVNSEYAPIRSVIKAESGDLPGDLPDQALRQILHDYTVDLVIC